MKVNKAFSSLVVFRQDAVQRMQRVDQRRYAALHTAYESMSGALGAIEKYLQLRSDFYLVILEKHVEIWKLADDQINRKKGG